jgi:hypothetical protein
MQLLGVGPIALIFVSVLATEIYAAVPALPSDAKLVLEEDWDGGAIRACLANCKDEILPLGSVLLFIADLRKDETWDPSEVDQI